eukprot:11336505-Alexandrium_andersonii.AAC.1
MQTRLKRPDAKWLPLLLADAPPEGNDDMLDGDVEQAEEEEEEEGEEEDEQTEDPPPDPDR